MFDVEVLKKALEDKEFAEAYAKIETVKEAVAALNGKGVEVTEEEFSAVAKVCQLFADKNGEIDDAELEKVAGGLTINVKLYNDPELLFPNKNIFDDVRMIFGHYVSE